MTVSKMHKLLAGLIKGGHGRACVTVHRETFHHPLDNVTYFQVHGVNVERVVMINDDGGTDINKDGSERYRTDAILYGFAAQIREGRIVSDGQIRRESENGE